MNGTTGGRGRRGRAWPRRAVVLAVTAGIVLLVAACGGGSSAGSGGSPTTGGSSAGSGGSPTTGGPTQAQQDLAFAQCMRSDGLPGFPDPSPSGGFGNISGEENGPHFETGYRACKHLLPAGGENKAQQNLVRLLQFAQCMRSHGVPTYPDPDPNAYNSISNTKINALHLAGVNPNSPQVQAAVQTCERLHPLASASPS
jgi:hypothetical protein